MKIINKVPAEVLTLAQEQVFLTLNPDRSTFMSYVFK